MASDAGWGAFMTNLIKTGQVPTYIKSAIAFRTDEVHPAIKTLGKRYYVSESDELFEGVSFGWGKHRLPDEDEFRHLIRAQDEQRVKKLEPSRWDSSGEYIDVVDGVLWAVSGGAVKVYRVEGSGARVEYFIVGVERGEEKIVGVKVLATESYC